MKNKSPQNFGAPEMIENNRDAMEAWRQISASAPTANQANKLMAQRIGVGTNSVWDWGRRGKVPPRHWDALDKVYADMGGHTTTSMGGWTKGQQVSARGETTGYASPSWQAKVAGEMKDQVGVAWMGRRPSSVNSQTERPEWRRLRDSRTVDAHIHITIGPDAWTIDWLDGYWGQEEEAEPMVEPNNTRDE